MERFQTIFLCSVVCILTTVIYLWSNQKKIGISLPLEAHIVIEEEEKFQMYHTQRRANFILILTDDQDVVLESAEEMEYVKKYIKNDGVEFKNSFVVSPLCCPSRSSIFSGQYVHNHKTFNNSINGGCSSKIWQNGAERKSFVNTLHETGYNTFFAGKYLNMYGEKEVGGLEHVPPGWDWWIGLKGNSKYYDYTLSVNGSKEDHGFNPSTDYLTNVMKKRALEFLNTLPSQNNPFFMMLSTPACHAPFDSEPKYVNNFSKYHAPRTKNFNIVNDYSKHWLLRLGEQPLRKEIINKMDEIYRKRLRTLMSVDVMVKEIIELIRDKGILNSTYIIFTSDNGYHLGQFSLPLDKREPYEFDIRVPFYIRGPGISSSKVLEHPITNIDIAPTILDLAGFDIPKYFDGESLKSVLQKEEEFTLKTTTISTSVPSPPYQFGKSKAFSTRKTLLVEHKGEGGNVNKGCEYLGPGLGDCHPEFDCKCSDSKNNTYSCLRHMNEAENFVYCLWEDDEHFEEYYNLGTDFNQLNNTINYISHDRRKKLNVTLNNLKKCKGSHCYKLSKFVF